MNGCAQIIRSYWWLTSIILVFVIAGLLAGACPARANHYTGVDLLGLWRHQFDINTAGSIAPQVPLSTTNSAFAVDGADFERTSNRFRNRITLRSRGVDFDEWARNPPRPLKFVEIHNLSPLRLKELPEEVLAEITHLVLKRGFDDGKLAEELRFARTSLPSLTALSVDMLHLGIYSSMEYTQSVVSELVRFSKLSQLRLESLQPVVTQRHGAEIAVWLASLDKLVRLDLSKSRVDFWSGALAEKLSSLEWLSLSLCERFRAEEFRPTLESLKSLQRLALCEGIPHDVFWDVLPSLSKLRHLMLGSPDVTGWTPARLLLLQKLPELRGLSLWGGGSYDGREICDALNKLTGLHHLRIRPWTTKVDDGVKFHVPDKLTGLRTLRLSLLNVQTVEWVARQTELTELRTLIDDNPWMDVSGILAKLQACRKLNVLWVDFNNPPHASFEGIASLPVRELYLTGAIHRTNHESVASLIRACKGLEVLTMSADPSSMPRDPVPETPEEADYSTKVWNAIKGLKQLRVLVCPLPARHTPAEIFGPLKKLEILYLQYGAAYGPDAEDIEKTVQALPHLKVLIAPGVSDKLAAAIKKRSPNIILLRDLE